METHYELVFDDLMIKQFKKVAKNNQIKTILTKMMNKLELAGPQAGELLDSKFHLYELKNKKPPIRLYFRHILSTDEIYIFEYEMKTSKKKQQETIKKLKSKS